MGCVLILLVAIAGCGNAKVDTADVQNAAAVDLALAMATDGNTPLTVPAPALCARCNGTGVITQGDGHKTPCPLCNSGQMGPVGAGLPNFGGPLGDVRDLLAKGNRLADEAQGLLTAAKSKGVTVTSHIELPVSAVVSSRVPIPDFNLPAADTSDCANGQCPRQAAASGCANGQCPRQAAADTSRTIISRPRLFGRWRR